MTNDSRGTARTSTAPRLRRRFTISGVVQGVGFRPFVYALARDIGLSGSVSNTGTGVVAEVEGPVSAVLRFGERLTSDAPALARVDAVSAEDVPPRGGTEFVIDASHRGGGRTLVSPDVATCAECLAELADPADRRYRHPFITCTNCGPRFTIVVDLPYDRPTTTMAGFPMCVRCAAEYRDPGNRRFHAQTVACPHCGPTLRLHRPGESDAIGNGAMAEARRLLAAGVIIAVKGVGGYHLACDARDETAVATLRKRKDRGDKPFAVMLPNIEAAADLVHLDSTERSLLLDLRRPIVLSRRREDAREPLADSVAPEHPDLGVFLPYTPVHHLLFGLPGDPAGPTALVMTSGNLSGEPIVTDDDAARHKLAPLADAWLWHDRPIHVPCDDSVVRVAGGSVLPVRRSRGYAPMPLSLPVVVPPSLAVGGDIKNAFCAADGRYAWMSAHVGDMDDLATLTAFDAATTQLCALTGVQPTRLVVDRHPGYRGTAWARRHPAGLPVHQIQHHHAHIASAMADAGHDGSTPVIGVAFDGTGYGDDGAVWGGEVLIADYAEYRRAAHLRYVPLPGGDAGVRNPCRMALAHLSAAGLEWDERLPSVSACTTAERAVLRHQLATGLACVPTSSMGRLFDAMSSLAGVCHRVAYEAEAAMRFEDLARDSISDRAAVHGAYRFGLVESADCDEADAAPVVAAAVADVLAGTARELVAARFHLAVVDLVVALAMRIRERTELSTVAISGGVFLNAVLTTYCERELTEAGFHVLRHHNVPPSDAGLALGQLVAAAVSDNRRSAPCA